MSISKTNKQIVKIAFDADAVLFSEESEYIYQTEGLDNFNRHELEHRDQPLNAGPFANLLIKLSKVQSTLSPSSNNNIRIAIITSRSAPSHLRVIETLRKWNVCVDETYFMGGLSKTGILEASGAQIFFDDHEGHLDPASKVVPSAKVPYRSTSPMKKILNMHFGTISKVRKLRSVGV